MSPGLDCVALGRARHIWHNVAAQARGSCARDEATDMRKLQPKTWLTRRRLLALGGAALAFPALARAGLARSYPSRAIRIVVGYAAGGATDITARLLAERLGERFNHQVIVE